MTSLFDKLNLAPAERRLVVIVGIVVFVVLNFWLVFPEFGEWAKNEQRIRDASTKLKTYKDEIARKAAYEKELKELEQQGSQVATEEAALRLSQEVNSQAALSGVTLTSISPLQRGSSTPGKTNAFFEEASITVSINSSEKELIDFLYRLADKDILVRARTMNLSPDPSRMRLQGPITLVKSYQRRPPPKATPSAPTARPGTKPADKPAETPAAKPAPAQSTTAPKTPSTTNAPSTRKAPSAVKP